MKIATAVIAVSFVVATILTSEVTAAHGAERKNGDKHGRGGNLRGGMGIGKELRHHHHRRGNHEGGNLHGEMGMGMNGRHHRRGHGGHHKEAHGQKMNGMDRHNRRKMHPMDHHHRHNHRAGRDHRISDDSSKIVPSMSPRLGSSQTSYLSVVNQIPGVVLQLQQLHVSSPGKLEIGLHYVNTKGVYEYLGLADGTYSRNLPRGGPLDLAGIGGVAKGNTPNGQALTVEASIKTSLVFYFTPEAAETGGTVDGELKSVVVYMSSDSKGKLFMSSYFVQGEYAKADIELYQRDISRSCPVPGVGGGNVYISDAYCNSRGVANFACDDGMKETLLTTSACLPRTNSSIGYDGIFSRAAVGSYLNPEATLVITKSSEKRFVTSWTPVAAGGSKALAVTTSWTKSSSTATNKGTAYGFTEGISAAVKVKEGIIFESASEQTTLSFAASQTISHSTTRTVQQSETESNTITCTPIPCDGVLYQWQVSGSDAYGNEQFVQSCDFQCVPGYINAGPQCPQGYCSSPSCQCCNEKWSSSDAKALIDSRAPGLDGTCVPPDADGTETPLNMFKNLDMMP